MTAGNSALATRKRIGIAAAALMLSCAMPAFAQTTVRSAADPARVPPATPSAAQRFDELLRAPSSAVPSVELNAAPAGAAEQQFTLHALTVEGMTAYSPETIEAYYADKLGKTISLADLYGIANALQQRYFDDGYTLTKVIVPQDAVRSDGTTRLLVIEGHVGQVEMDSDLPDSPALRDAVAQIKSMRPLNTRVLERLLLVLNDLPGARVSAILATLKNPSPAEQIPGSVRIIIKKNEKVEPRAKLAVNNFGSQFSGPWQGVASAHIYDIGVDHSDLMVALSGTDPLSEQRYGNLNYSMPLFGASGTKLNVGALWARTRPGDNLEALEIEGETTNFSLGISYPLLRQRSGSWLVDGMFAFKQTETDLLGNRLYNDRLRVLRVGTNYSFSDAWEGFNALDFHASQGFDLFGASEQGTALSRADGTAEFSKIEFFTGRVQSLPSGFELYGLVSGQYAFNPLLSVEEFGFGGEQTGRGYDPSEITGDHGISATAELRYTSEFSWLGSNLVAQPYGFYDIGKVWNIDNGAREHVSASSAGGGVRFNLDNQWNSNVFAAVPLTRRADNPPNYANPTGARFLISISRDF